MIVLCAIFIAILPYLIPFVLILGTISLVANYIRLKNRPADIPDNPYEEILGNQTKNPFEENYSRSNNPNVIDVEYTEYEDTDDKESNND